MGTDRERLLERVLRENILSMSFICIRLGWDSLSDATSGARMSFPAPEMQRGRTAYFVWRDVLITK